MLGAAKHDTRTSIKNGAVPDEGREATHATERPVSDARSKKVRNTRKPDIPVELVDEDGAERLFAVRCTRRFYLVNVLVWRVRDGLKARHTFSISAGMRSARRSLSVGAFAEVDANRAERAKAERRD